MQEISDALWGQVFISYQDDILGNYCFRLVWTLPGKTKIVCHLKDKKKIRNKKRYRNECAKFIIGSFKVVSDHVHVLPAGLQDHGAADQRREEGGEKRDWVEG